MIALEKHAADAAISLLAICTGFGLDRMVGDPASIPHPVSGMGKTIRYLECHLRSICPKTAAGERTAGALIWLVTAGLSFGLPFAILRICRCVSLWLYFIMETVMCTQILAVKSLETESMKVYAALSAGKTEDARTAVSMIVGRDTRSLDEKGIIKAAVETVAENTTDAAVSPLFYMILGGAPLGFFYKAVNTMDSMLGYVDPPYKEIGLVPARMDDVMNYLPARISAALMLAAGALYKMNLKDGARIFRRDRYCHASPNSAQTEAVCAGLLGIQLGGDAYYHGILHQKKYIGDPLRSPEKEDIPKACRLMKTAASLSLLLFAGIRMLCFML